AEFQKRRDYILARIAKMKHVAAVKPGGAFYIFCDIHETKLDSMAFSGKFLDDMLVAVIPGIAFGDDRYIRMSFATGLPQIEKGMDRLEQFLNKL
ncbi:MAG: aspartate transaminase, partial [Candidatus Omnitrophota bacterium]